MDLSHNTHLHSFDFKASITSSDVSTCVKNAIDPIESPQMKIIRIAATQGVLEEAIQNWKMIDNILQSPNFKQLRLHQFSDPWFDMSVRSIVFPACSSRGILRSGADVRSL